LGTTVLPKDEYVKKISSGYDHFDNKSSSTVTVLSRWQRLPNNRS